MKQGHAYIDGSTRRALAIVFACLLIFQAFGLVHATAAMAAPTQPGAVAGSVEGIAAAASEHCNRLAHDGAPANGHCDHAGFCAFCAASDREAALFDAPPASPLIGILAPEDEPAGRFARSFDRSAPLLSSAGLDESRYATAPPRV